MKFKANSAEIAEFLKSQPVQDMVREAAESLAARAGDGFEVVTSIEGDRARAAVTAVSDEARLRQARDHILERTLGGG